MSTPTGVEVHAPVEGRAAEILSPAALDFLAGLQRRFGAERDALLAGRRRRAERLAAGELPGLLDETRAVREADWRVAPAPPDLRDRRVEITGPVERKMMINALNSGARVFMADFEDSNSPTWRNVVEGHANLIDAVDRTIEFASPEGRTYRLAEQTATLVVRPRGWHMVEERITVDGRPVSASLADAGLFLFHNARRLLDRGSGPYLYLPKLEGHLEARLWDRVFSAAEERLGIAHGSVRATVLIETILAAFEMEEILYELRDHAAGLNAGRWDYIFSIIKKFRDRPEFVLPDRAQVTMTVPFMRAYTEQLVRACHRRGAHAIGGMAAFVPSRRDPRVNETAVARVREDKQREAGDGFDGTWVAHPDLVPVALEVFDGVLGERPNQVDRLRDEVGVETGPLLDVRIEGSSITEAGLRNNVSVGIQYLEAWLRGTGAVTIFNLMEDAATAEIARSQVWQWVRHGVRLDDGQTVTRALVEEVVDDEMARIREAVGEQAWERGRHSDARRVFVEVALSDSFPEFLTGPAQRALG